MKRVLLAVTGTALGLVALLSFKTRPPVATSGPLPSASAPAATSTAAGPAPRANASSKAATARRYTGQAVETPYGIVQVALTATGSHIDSVRFLQLTAFDQRSQEINSAAAPILIQETLGAQSARIDTVSGATYTTDGYLQSLQSALDQAGI